MLSCRLFVLRRAQPSLPMSRSPKSRSHLLDWQLLHKHAAKCEILASVATFLLFRNEFFQSSARKERHSTGRRQTFTVQCIFCQTLVASRFPSKPPDEKGTPFFLLFSLNKETPNPKPPKMGKRVLLGYLGIDGWPQLPPCSGEGKLLVVWFVLGKWILN